MTAVVLVLLAVLLAMAAAEPTTTTGISPNDPGLVYDGNGGLSAGASSRLLLDYDDGIRSALLDALFLPHYGANLHVCKVEIGGSTQSTDGTEQSHMYTRDDLNCTRGYEFWLMKEARQRNPAVLLYGLAWGAPYWLNNQSGYFGPDTVDYHVKWMQCAHDYHGLTVDRLGIWNEKPWGNADYIKQLRRALNAANFTTTQLILVDGGIPSASDALWRDLAQDADFNRAVDALGAHYPCSAAAWPVQPYTIRTQYGKKTWASEDWWSQADFGGAACWAKLFNQNFLRMNITSTVAWSTIWSVYPEIDAFEGKEWGPGLVYAWEPWSGHFVIPPTVWTSAHTMQFAQPGWLMLRSASGTLAANGSYVTYVSPDRTLFATVIETAVAHCDHCAYDASTAASVPQLLKITLLPPLHAAAPGSHLALWATNETLSFVQLPDIVVDANSVATLEIQPGTIYTLTNTQGQSRLGEGRDDLPQMPPAPPSAPFPSVYDDEFETVLPQQPGRYWADQCGSFQVEPAPGNRTGQALTQKVLAPAGVNAWTTDLPNPVTVLGNVNWTNFKVTVSVYVDWQGAERQEMDASHPPYVYTNGRIIGGTYDHSASGFADLAAAEAFCDAQPQCRGFTFDSPSASPVASDTVWFTSLRAVHTDEKDWQSYTQGPPPTPQPSLTGRWAGLCVRVSSAQPWSSGFQAVCLQLNATMIQLIDSTGDTDSVVVQSRRVLQPALAPGWHDLEVQTDGDQAYGLLDGVAVVNATVTATRGMVALESGYHAAAFDNFVLAAV